MCRKAFISYVPIINLAIATTSLGFQITILNPWHKKLSNDFNEVKCLIKDQNKK